MFGWLFKRLSPEEIVLVEVDPVACANERLNAVRARVDEVLERSMK